MSTGTHSFVITLLGLAAFSPYGTFAQQPAGRTTGSSKAQAVIDQAAQEGKYTFVLFYKQNDAATAAMNSTLQQALVNDADQASIAIAQVNNPAELALVTKHDVARAPMPMTMVLAPNGAITGVFAQKLTTANIHEAFVSPTMMEAMKALQDGKLVFVAVRGLSGVQVPGALKEFQSDPHFKGRTVALSMQAADPQETKFLSQMQLDPRGKTTQVVLLAPPGVLVGKFSSTASKDEIAAALASAGKCCDDPNCKHHQQPTSPKTATQTPATRRK
jgi:hypothetical protein